MTKDSRRVRVGPWQYRMDFYKGGTIMLLIPGQLTIPCLCREITSEHVDALLPASGLMNVYLRRKGWPRLKPEPMHFDDFKCSSIFIPHEVIPPLVVVFLHSSIQKDDYQKVKAWRRKGTVGIGLSATYIPSITRDCLGDESLVLMPKEGQALQEHEMHAFFRDQLPSRQ